MNFYDNASTCLECYTGIDRDVDAFSKRHFGAPLCVGCQQRLKRDRKLPEQELKEIITEISMFALLLAGPAVRLCFE